MYARAKRQRKTSRETCLKKSWVCMPFHGNEPGRYLRGMLRMLLISFPSGTSSIFGSWSHRVGGLWRAPSLNGTSLLW
eukprot:9382480-Pyramimonas_sp.AAC.1